MVDNFMLITIDNRYSHDVFNALKLIIDTLEDEYDSNKLKYIYDEDIISYLANVAGDLRSLNNTRYSNEYKNNSVEYDQYAKNVATNIKKNISINRNYNEIADILYNESDAKDIHTNLIHLDSIESFKFYLENNNDGYALFSYILWVNQTRILIRISKGNYKTQTILY